MTEAEWLACTDPLKLLGFLRSKKSSNRKFRLFACACCRRIWTALTDGRGRKAVEAAERYADGLVERKELTAAMRAVAWAAQVAGYGSPQAIARDVTLVDASWAAHCVVVQEVTDPLKQVVLLADIFGNPFRPVSFNPAVLTWNDATVVRLAQAAYDDRQMLAGTLDNGRLVVLADALEEAGCDDGDILTHCRGPGPHVRGCWVIDLILGKS